jgi:ABC-type nickel/cobalt efflux system permease component RcnA
VQDYAKAHVVLSYQQKRSKRNRWFYRMTILSGIAGCLFVDALRMAIGAMSLTWLSLLACVLGMAITLVAALAVMWVSFHTWAKDKMFL